MSPDYSPGLIFCREESGASRLAHQGSFVVQS